MPNLSCLAKMLKKNKKPFFRQPVYVNRRVCSSSNKSFFMTLLAKLTLVPLALLGISGPRTAAVSNGHENVIPAVTAKKVKPKIQAAILLDVSGSMQGLIEQAKAQLWTMVSTMGRASCDGQAPDIELALYEYGRTNNDAAKGYVKQISAFTADLDQVSKDLFTLTTNGGDEYCGQVIYTSINELKWDTASTSYKVIFIAGNEDFLQGSLHYTKSCNAAKDKGIIVNTIYCGDRMQGIREHWNLGAECGNGSFTNINSNARIEEIPTPYDSTLIAMSSRINRTYIGYGELAAANTVRQEKMDEANASMGAGVAAKRASVKGNAALYRNDSWDLVDAANNDKDFIKKLDMKTLPDSLRSKSREQLQQMVDAKNAERAQIQNEIKELNAKRDAYIANEKAKAATQNKEATLETEVEKIIKEQAKRHNMIIQ